MYKIAIIIPYFGEFPIWMNLFLYSCTRNHNISDNITIDWFFITDIQNSRTIKNNYPYIHIINKSFNEYCDYISSILKFDFHPAKPYKLCDLKPFYGIVHKDLIKNYTHWGFGDIDLCYGDLSILINEKRLNKYDLLTTHADRIAGHLTIIKKSSAYQNFCFNIKDYDIKLKDRNLGLDEHDFTNLVRPSMLYLEYFYRHFLKRFFRKCVLCMYDFMKFPNMIHNLYSKSYIKEFYTSPAPKMGEKWFLDIEKNKIYNPSNKEIPYLHFLFFKKTPFWNTPNYWKPGFYQIGNDIPDKGFIFFDNEKICYKESL